MLLPGALLLATAALLLVLVARCDRLHQSAIDHIVAALLWMQIACATCRYTDSPAVSPRGDATWRQPSARQPSARFGRHPE